MEKVWEPMTYRISSSLLAWHELVLSHLSSLILLLVMPFLLPQPYSTTQQIGLHLPNYVLPAILSS